MSDFDALDNDDNDDDALEGTAISVAEFVSDLESDNAGVEGLAFDPETGDLFFANENVWKTNFLNLSVTIIDENLLRAQEICLTVICWPWI